MWNFAVFSKYFAGCPQRKIPAIELLLIEGKFVYVPSKKRGTRGVSSVFGVNEKPAKSHLD